jgi:hypothetical protein
VGLSTSLARNLMIWSVWALMLIVHGAFSGWARTASQYAFVSLFGDVLMVAIALITIDQLQGLGVVDFLRIGLFFAGFGYCGRQLMNSVIKHAAR